MQNNLENALEAFMKKYQCSEETADRYFREAKCLHSRKSLYITNEEGDDSGDVMEEVANDLEKDGDHEQSERLLKLLDENPDVSYFDYYEEEPITREWIKKRLGIE